MENRRRDSWPSGESEMAERIRALGWSTTPLGPTEGWPQSLKTIVDLMLGSPSMMSLVWGPDAIHLYNDAFTELLREHRALALGRSIFETFARSRKVFEADIAAGMAGRSARLLAQCYPVLRRGQLEDAWFDVEYVPIRGEAGVVAGVLWTLRETTTQRLAEQALRASERWQQTLVEGVPQLVWRAVGDGQWTWASPQWTTYTGQVEADSHGLGWLEPVHPDDRDGVKAVWAGAIERGSYHANYRILNAAQGRYRWFQTRATPVRDASGEVIEWLGTSTDIDDLRQMQESQSLMVAELQHRTRNLIGVVNSIAADTMRETGPTPAFRTAFSDRLSALSRVQGLLSRSEDEPITIGALLRLELDALGVEAAGGRVALKGPEVELRPSTVQTLALALHELATNARKHGALSHKGGRLAVAWCIRSKASEQRLTIEWVETGLEQVPERSDPEKQDGGYGRELIEHALPYALGARTSYALSASGVRCTIDLAVRTGSEQL